METKPTKKTTKRKPASKPVTKVDKPGRVVTVKTGNTTTEIRVVDS